MDRKLVAAISLCCSMISGCVNFGARQAPAQELSPDTIIAIDLVNALKQIQGLQPGAQRIQMKDSSAGFGKTLHETLSNAGYAVQMVENGQRDGILDYSVSQTVGTGENTGSTYQIDVADVKIKRSYLINAGKVQPNSNLYVRGTDASNLKLNDQIFHQQIPVIKDYPLVENSQHEIPREVLNEMPLETVNVDAIDEPILQMVTDRGSDSVVYRSGESINVLVTSSVDSRLYCFYKDGYGAVVKLFPNRFSPDNRVAAGQVKKLPGTDKWSIEATRSGHFDEIMCFAASENTDPKLQIAGPDLEPLPLTSLDQVYEQFRKATGESPIKRIIDVEVI